ncbi:MAG: fumarylacetoacetate hydrolase family protein [Opitutales bacterium]|nr:fumarylacetoacetate hydrolase family protein [Opitutales bacterium]
MIRLPVLHSTDHYTIRPSKIIGVGLNYHDHLTEHDRLHDTKTEVPREPVLFVKTPNTLIPSGSPIVLPSIVSEYKFDNPRTDYEGELSVIIKKRCRNLTTEEALNSVYGYTIMNDVSQRNFQKGDTSGWFRGKCLDTFGPIGPAVLLAKDCPDAQSLKIETRHNGKIVQSSSTAEMIFPVAHLIAFASRMMTLEEGDILSTGTPSGVGSIQDGDRVEITISGIGTLSNPVTTE